jgi:microfibrillar-associated protein 1
MASSQGNVLSREELLHGLLGDGLSEIIARPSSNRGIAASQKPPPKKEVADLTRAETAALLAEQQQTKSSSQTTASRLYAVTKQEREYHKLLHEQVPSLSEAVSRTASEPAGPPEPNEEQWIAPSGRTDGTTKSFPAPRSDASSRSDDASTSEEDAPRRRRNVALSDSEDDAEDRRRARLQRVRQRPRQEAIILQASHEEPKEEKDPPTDGVVETPPEPPPRNAVSRRGKALSSIKEKLSNSSSDEDSSSSSSEEEEDSSSDDDDDGDVANAVARPKFVPKHLRDKPSTASETAHWEEQEERQREQEERRKQESRALVQQVVVQAQSNASTQDYYDLDGAGSAAGEEEEEEEADPIAARDAWEVRELERILEEYEMELARQREEHEHRERRRRPWRDAEVPETATTDRRSKPAAPGSKFFHRGAYYMDDTEWEATDVRHRAVEYAQTPVLNDHQHRDRTQLPKVMQVKQFGRANQSKYKGLAAEDTTDRKMEMLPIVRPKGK